jgi:pyruvate,water dikinase
MQLSLLFQLKSPIHRLDNLVFKEQYSGIYCPIYMQEKYIVQFHEVGIKDVAIVGGKGANLGEMTQLGVPVPPGFIVTSKAYFTFIDENNLKQRIHEVLDPLDVNDSASLEKAAMLVMNIILQAPMPADIAQEIKESYRALSGSQDILVATRSSATAEDLPDASFAGQQASFLNVFGEDSVVENVKKCWASLFEGRAIFYRTQQKYDHFKVGIAVPVQKMVESEVSGVMFSIDPVTNDANKIVVEAVFGLGEYIVLGAVTPDHYEIDKASIQITKKQIVNQTHKLVRAQTGESAHNMDVSTGDVGSQQKLSDENIITLARISKKLEDHYAKPQDSEWAVENNTVYIVQTRPITTQVETAKIQGMQISDDDKKVLETQSILSGAPASPGVSCGPVVIIHSPTEIDKVKEGDVLVTEMTTPDYVPAMKRAAAIITDNGGRTCHAAIVSRELGIPCVVGTDSATKILTNGQIVTIDGSNGKIYNGGKPHKLLRDTEFDQYANLQTKTKVFVNLAEPERAEEIARMIVDGVGLLRAEFMIAEIGTHPKKLIAEGKQQIFIDKLYTGLATFARAFNPRHVLYRATDFKSNEYKNLEGGAAYEPDESNPMLGFRGCFRYIQDPAVFNLELEAIKKVYTQDHLQNLHLEIPFVRTVDEMTKVRALVDASGLTALPGFELWMMVEIPSNVILLPEFIQAGKLNGVSIGSNDLTMLILGTDRDNTGVASEFDERNEAVMWALERVVTTANQNGIKASICGQAPSVYPEITQKLVSWGIDSISVSPDVIYKTRKVIYDVEQAAVNN